MIIRTFNKHCTMVGTETKLENVLKYEIYSYDTYVAAVFIKGKDNYTIKRRWFDYSSTTMRDINTCLSCLGIEKKLTKKEWEAM